MSYQGPGTYRHYKGGEYEVLGLSVDEATSFAIGVIYKPANGSDTSSWMVDGVETATQFFRRPLRRTDGPSAFNDVVFVDGDDKAEASVCSGDGWRSHGSVGGDAPISCPGCHMCRPDDFTAKNRFERIA